MSEHSTPVTKVGARECRACLSELKLTSNGYDLFFCWESLWDGSKTTIADDLAKLANIEIPKGDPHTNLICEQCHTKLLSACQFVNCVQNSDKILKQRFQGWPEPIKLDIIRQGVSKNEETVIKQELMTDDECEGIEEFSNETEIKIEPEEFVMPSVSSDCGTTMPDLKPGLPNGAAVKIDPHLVVGIKEEPWSEEEVGLDLPLDCILCSKTFNSVRGLRAHVIAQHSYKTVKRKTGSSPQKKQLEKYKCQTCRRVFQTQTDLMVHETCHDKHTCFACTQKFDTFALLTKHRKRCKAVTSKQKYKTLEDAIRPVSNKDAKKVAGIASNSNKHTNNQESKYFVKNLKTAKPKELAIGRRIQNKANQTNIQKESLDNETEIIGKYNQISKVLNYGTLIPYVADNEPDVNENPEYILGDVEMQSQDNGSSENCETNEKSEVLNYGALVPNTNDPPDLEATDYATTDVEMQSRNNENRNSYDHNSGVLNYGALEPNIAHQPLEEATQYILGDIEIQSPGNENSESITKDFAIHNLEPDVRRNNTLHDVEMTILDTEEKNTNEKIIVADDFSQDSSLSIKITKIVSEATDSNLKVSNVELNDYRIEDETVDNIGIELKLHSNIDLQVVDKLPVDVKSDDVEL